MHYINSRLTGLLTYYAQYADLTRSCTVYNSALLCCTTSDVHHWTKATLWPTRKTKIAANHVALLLARERADQW